jgi:hypothetical protein
MKIKINKINIFKKYKNILQNRYCKPPQHPHSSDWVCNMRMEKTTANHIIVFLVSRACCNFISRCPHFSAKY